MSFEVCILKICLELEKKVIARMRVKKKNQYLSMFTCQTFSSRICYLKNRFQLKCCVNSQGEVCQLDCSLTGSFVFFCYIWIGSKLCLLRPNLQVLKVVCDFTWNQRAECIGSEWGLQEHNWHCFCNWSVIQLLNFGTLILHVLQGFKVFANMCQVFIQRTIQNSSNTVFNTE